MLNIVENKVEECHNVAKLKSCISISEFMNLILAVD